MFLESINKRYVCVHGASVLELMFLRCVNFTVLDRTRSNADVEVVDSCVCVEMMQIMMSALIKASR